MSTLSQASHQWATRPADQRFTSLITLDEYVRGVKQHSTAKVIASRQIYCEPYKLLTHDVPGAPGFDHQGLQCIGPNGGPVNLTHWSFGQLAARAGAPAGYLRTLPSEMAADCLNYGLHVSRPIEDVGVLLYKNGGEPELRAATGPNYGRIWNETITRALINRFGDGLTGDFRVPGEFGKAVEVTNANTTLYASDRDMFVFLADETHRIEIPNRRNGEPGSLGRGFFVWNSEVGSATFGIAMFLFDYVCQNRMVWGAEQFQEVKIRHTVSAPDRWIEEAAPAIEAYVNSSSSNISDIIAAARAKRMGDNLDTFLANRFTKTQASAIKAAHIAEEQRPIETLWDVTVGVTAYAKGIQYQDQRVALEREAGKIIKLAA